MHVASTNNPEFQPRTGTPMFIGEVHAHGLIDDTMAHAHLRAGAGDHGGPRHRGFRVAG